MSDPSLRKRKRASLVCDNCKKKKIRCDKGHPCSQCIRAKITSSCVYQNNGISENDSNNGSLPYIHSAKNPMTFAASDGGMSNGKHSNISHNPNTPEEVTIPKEELDDLKGRLQQIESLLKALTSQSKLDPKFNDIKLLGAGDSVGIKSEMMSPIGSPIKLSPYPVKKNNASIQLPPINWNMLDINSGKAEGAQCDILFGNTPSSVDSLNSSSTQSTRSSRSDRESLSGINPYGDENETINFYENYTSIHVQEPMRRISFGPFAWSSLMKKDSGLRILWDYMIEQKEKSSRENNFSMMFSQSRHEVTQENTNVITSTFYGDKSDNAEAYFKKRALETDGYDDMVPYTNVLKARTDLYNKKPKLNENALPLGLTFYEGQAGKELRLSDKIQLHLIDKIQIILPTRKVIWKLIDRYFAWLYPFMPFIDEESLIRDISKILGPKSFEDTKIQQVKVERRLDLAHIGILLVVLRLSYLSLFCNKSSVNEERLNTTDPSPEAQDIKFLLSNPININTIDVAQFCLDQFQLLRKSSFPVLQLGLYMRLYHMYAPEDGDGADGGDAQVLTAMLIQMAYSLGLNREPDNFPDVCNDPKMNHLGRKIWHSLCFLDSYLGFCFGNPLSVDSMFFDTKIPFLEEGNENTLDPSMDKNVTQAFFSCGGACIRMREILLLVLNVNGKTKMSELTKLLSDLEIILNDEYGNLDECLKPLEKNCHAYVFTRNFRTKIYLSINAFFVSLYFHLYLYYEEKDVNLSFFYLKKMILIATRDIMPRYFDLLGNSDMICDFVINPTLEMTIHKSNQVNLACLVKTNFIIYSMTRDNRHNEKMIIDLEYRLNFRLLCKLSMYLTRCAEFSIEAISKISNRYYYAWRITKGHTYLLKTITNKDFYVDKYEEASHLCVQRFTIEQMEELIKICETTLNKVGKFETTSNEFQSEFCNIFYSESVTPSTRLNPSTENNYATTPNFRPTTYNIAKNDGDSRLKNKNIYKGFESNYVDNAEIDKLWFQMLSVKYDNKMFDSGIPESGDPLSYDSQRMANGFTNSPGVSFMDNNESSQKGPMATGFNKSQEATTPFSSQNNNSNIDRYGFDLEQAIHFDIFSELPLDQVFNNTDNVGI